MWYLPSVPDTMSILCRTRSLSAIPPPRFPYKPTACTSSTKVIAPYLWAMSHSSLSGQISPNKMISPIEMVTSPLTVHRMYRFKSDDLGTFDIWLGQQLLQMFRIIMTEDKLRSTAVTYSLNHRSMVTRIRINFTIWKTSDEEVVETLLHKYYFYLYSMSEWVGLLSFLRINLIIEK